MVIVAHRGASGYRPEHTLESYRLAIDLGAGYVEPDLVSTLDGVLVARHENEVSATTDIADHPELRSRRTTKMIDGEQLTGWFTEDLTLAELKTLRTRERLPLVRPHNTIYDLRFQVPTLQEIIDLVRVESERRGRRIGIYPETKHPTYFRSIGLGLEEPLAETLRRNDLATRDAAVFLQSFEPSSLRRLRALLPTATLVQLIAAEGMPYDHAADGHRASGATARGDRPGSGGRPVGLAADGDRAAGYEPRTYADLVTPAGLAWVAGFADVIGVDKSLVVPLAATGHLLEPTTLIPDAHRRGLAVHAWTLRAENQFLPADFRIGSDPNAWGGLVAEIRMLDRLGVDGVFCDFPDIAVAARSARRNLAEV